MRDSRTAKALKNSQVALLFYLINLALNFISRKVFIDHLGADVLGLNTTATNLLSFLNLAELGIASAISYTLYKPLHEKDYSSINEIVSVQGWLYRRIAYIVIATSVILMCFFPIIFEKITLPLWYAYGSFGVLLAGSLLSYFINYRQIILVADQKEYKITLNVQGFKFIKVILQMLTVVYLPNGYIYWLVLELLMSFITAIVLDRVLKLEYSWLCTIPHIDRKIRLKHPQIIQKTKQLFFHKIGGFVLTQTSPLIIYAYSSLFVVAVYGNYMLIIMGVTMLMTALFSSLTAGIGNLVAEHDDQKIAKVFEELFSSRFLLVGTICFVVYQLGQSFIILWIGEQYLLQNTSLFLIILILFINLMRTVVDSFINAYGLFQDVWATITESVLNVGCSVLLGYYYGINGILTGVLISLFVIIFIWKPFFLFRKGFHRKFSGYCILYLKHLLLFILSICVVFLLLGRMTIIHSWSEFMIHAISSCGFFFILFGTLLFCFSSGLRFFVQRMYSFIRKKY